MNQSNASHLILLGSAPLPIQDDSNTPRIVKNIERMSDRYRKYIESEMAEELDNQAEQAERVKKLKAKDPTAKASTGDQS